MDDIHLKQSEQTKQTSIGTDILRISRSGHESSRPIISQSIIVLIKAAHDDNILVLY